MREYFNAWAQQDVSIRDYKPYFKPVLCILEGAWTKSDGSIYDFQSDRHHLDALDWHDMEEKVHFMTSTGGKNGLENLAQLPRKIVGLDQNSTRPIMAQWNVRVVCHP